MLNKFLNDEYAYDSRDLGFYRVLFSFVVLSGLSSYLWVGKLEPFMFSPPLSIAALFDQFPPAWVSYGLMATVGAAGLCLLLAIKPRLSSIALSLSWLGLLTIAFSTGKINHGILLQVAPFIFAFSMWGKSFQLSQSESEQKNQLCNGFPVAVFAFLTAFWMATAGWQKLYHGWLDPSFSAVHDMLYNNAATLDRTTLLGEFALTYFPWWIWESKDWFTVIFELAGIVLVWKREYFRYWIFAACFFHLGIDLFMSIPYDPAPLAYAAVVPWSRLGVVQWLAESRQRTVKLFCGLLLAAAIFNVANYCYPSKLLRRSIVWGAPCVALYFGVQRVVAVKKTATA